MMAAKKMGGFKVCQKCNKKNGTRATKCKQCGEPFPVKQRKRSGATWEEQLEGLRQSLLQRKTEIGERILQLKAEEKEINKRLDKLNG